MFVFSFFFAIVATICACVLEEDAGFDYESSFIEI